MEISNIVRKEIKEGIFDPLMKVLIVFDSSNGIIKNNLEEICYEVFGLFWTFHFGNTLIMFVLQEQIQVYTYKPFLRQMQNHSDTINAIDFNNKWLNNFNKYQLRTEAMVDRSLYVETIVDNKSIGTGMSKFFNDALIEYFNATETHMVLHGRYYMNLSYNLVNNISDICINSKAYHINPLRKTIFMYPILRNDMCIMMPELTSFSPLQRIRNLITFRLMMLFLIIIILSILVWCLQFKYNHSSFTILDQLFLTFALMTSVSSPLRSSIMKRSERILLVSWLLTSLLTISAFNAMFFRGMLAPIKKVEVNTPEKIIKHGKAKVLMNIIYKLLYILIIEFTKTVINLNISNFFASIRYVSKLQNSIIEFLDIYLKRF